MIIWVIFVVREPCVGHPRPLGELVFVGRDEKRGLLKTPAWEAKV